MARAIRHEVKFHYSPSAVCDNLRHLPDGADLTFYTHELGGNDFYPVGEEVVFQARIEKHFSTSRSKAEKNERFANWCEWNIETTRWLHSVAAYFVNELVFSKFPERNWNLAEYEVPAELLGDLSSITAPIFAKRTAE